MEPATSRDGEPALGRVALGADRPVRSRGFSGDTELSWRARDAGVSLRFEPSAIVAHEHEVGLRGFLRERIARGEDFGRMRIESERWSRLRAAAQLAATPLVPLLLLGRALRHAERAGRFAKRS